MNSTHFYGKIILTKIQFFLKIYKNGQFGAVSRFLLKERPWVIEDVLHVNKQKPTKRFSKGWTRLDHWIALNALSF